VIRQEKEADRLELAVEGGESAKNRIDEFSKRLKQETLVTFDKIEILEKVEEGLRVVDKREGRTF
jgi:hypothetical protein